ncbi:hypothetical protein RCH23_001388 [Cryobacterium sp. CAN_C3]|uniref:hypothetical protein n=1 Tax=unclassified Cryobacterium TaxID=2649013 RepID=UPI0018CB1FDA|nr:hypothetical protein [Cryobacterium sp. CAN_C3]MEC5154014.1 hypothetical protein [Cryobacterium sp. CAN_C3]
MSLRAVLPGLGETGLGTMNGGVRGLSIYALTNFTATSAAVASAIVTASFGIAEQAHKLRTGQITEIEFLENAELVSLDAAVSALSSFIGQAAIPIPVLGAVIGNAVGMVMYRSVRDSLSKREEQLIEKYLEYQRALDQRLDDEYQALIEQLNEGLDHYFNLLEKAFDPEPRLAFVGSISLAHEIGVSTEDLLVSEEKVSTYFLD